MESAWIGLGSNLGDRLANLRSAVEMLMAPPGTKITAASSVYLAKPVGEGFSRDFYNAVVGLRTPLKSRELLKACLGIEDILGRDRDAGPDRTIDLDLLLYRDLVIDEPDLRVPHPRMLQRRFVLQPLAEVAPFLIHPGRMLTVKRLLADLDEDQHVERLEASLLPPGFNPDPGE